MKLRSFFASFAIVLALGSTALTARLPHAAAQGTEEANITRLTARLLDQSHYAGRHFDRDVAGSFLDHYLEMLDPNRLYFLESDLQEFAPYRTNLDDLTLKKGDTSPARRIFERYQQRVEQRVECAQALLKTEGFDFTGDGSYRWDRENAPRPRDMAAAKELWRQHLRYEYLQEKLNKKKPEEIARTLSKRYDRILHSMKQWDADEVLEVYLTALAHAYDPHSDYMGRRQVEDFSISMNLSLVGVGATLHCEDGYCKIHDLVPGGPAARSKLIKPGDRIVAVAQEGKEPVDVIDMPLPEAVALIRGPKGTKVSLTLIPAGATDASARKTVTIVRDEVKLEDQEAKARLVDLPLAGGRTARLGVIDLPSFYSGTDSPTGHSHRSATADVARLIEKLQREHAQGLILDLRRNGGGSLEEAIRLTGLFIKQGPVVQTKDTDGEVRIETDPDPSVLYDGPLVVLTSRLSASASEILTGALQDYGRALIVGDSSTYGKGTVQSVVSLGPIMKRMGLPTEHDPGALKLTIRKFYRPDGASTQLRGVASDLVLPSPTGPLKVGEAGMRNPLRWDMVPPAPHAHLNRVAPYLATLEEQSARRTAADEDFGWLREDARHYQEQLANPVASLNEKQRLEEKAHLDAQGEERKKLRAARPPAHESQYEITLKNVDREGLPEPVTVAAASHKPALPGTALDPSSAEGDNGDKDLARDVTLGETERVLADYVALLKGDPTTALAGANPVNHKPQNLVAPN